MEIPESVQIGPYRYAVKADADELMRYEHRQMSSVWGCIRWKEMDILLDPAADNQRLRETLLHEIIHGCNDVAGTGGLTDEERFTTALAPTLLDTLRRNPALVSYLTSDDPYRPKGAP
jgi:hypothetical protein